MVISLDLSGFQGTVAAPRARLVLEDGRVLARAVLPAVLPAAGRSWHLRGGVRPAGPGSARL